MKHCVSYCIPIKESKFTPFSFLSTYIVITTDFPFQHGVILLVQIYFKTRSAWILSRKTYFCPYMIIVSVTLKTLYKGPKFNNILISKGYGQNLKSSLTVAIYFTFVLIIVLACCQNFSEEKHKKLK